MKSIQQEQKETVNNVCTCDKTTQTHLQDLDSRVQILLKRNTRADYNSVPSEGKTFKDFTDDTFKRKSPALVFP